MKKLVSFVLMSVVLVLTSIQTFVQNNANLTNIHPTFN